MVIVCKFCIYWYGQVLRSLSFADVPIIIIIQCNLWEKKYCVLLRYIIIFFINLVLFFQWKIYIIFVVVGIFVHLICSYNYHCPSSSQVWSTSFSRQGESYVGDITTPPKQKPLTTTTIQRDCKTSLSESDLWQQIDLHFFTSYIATTIINEHDKLVQVFPNLINVCRNSDQIGPL